MVKGPYAICPDSGADLSEDRHPDERNIQHREPETDDHDVLSTGQTHSSTRALVAFFERNYRDLVDDPSDRVVSRASHYLRTLKSETDVRDEWVWYALCERLYRDGHDSSWMRQADVVLVCPHCGSWLKYRPAPKGDLLPKCGINCRDQDEFVFGDIRDMIRETYNEAFADTSEEHIERGHLEIA